MLLEHEDISTSRLALIAITPKMLFSEQRNDQSLADLVEGTVPPNWPPAAWEPHVLEMLLAQYERCPEQVAWQRYIGYRQPDGTRTLIGAVGAFWNEARPEECEIGYSILPPYEGCGLATEAAQALIRFIGRRAPIKSIVAHTFPELIGSVRVLEKCGFVTDGMGEEAGALRYRLHL